MVCCICGNPSAKEIIDSGHRFTTFHVGFCEQHEIIHILTDDEKQTVTCKKQYHLHNDEECLYASTLFIWSQDNPRAHITQILKGTIIETLKKMNEIDITLYCFAIKTFKEIMYIPSESFLLRHFILMGLSIKKTQSRWFQTYENVEGNMTYGIHCVRSKLAGFHKCNSCDIFYQNLEDLVIIDSKAKCFNCLDIEDKISNLLQLKDILINIKSNDSHDKKFLDLIKEILNHSGIIVLNFLFGPDVTQMIPLIAKIFI